MISDILKHWNMADATVTELTRPHMSEGERTIWDVDGRYMLKLQPDCVIKLAQLLADEGIPVARYLPMVDGNMITQDGYALMTKIEGTHIDLFEQPHLTVEFGRQLGRLHRALAKIETHFDDLEDSNFLEQWHDYIVPGLGDGVCNDFRNAVEAKLTEICPKLPHQLIHRDVHCQNTLFDDGKLVGWIDFDLHHRNARIFDMAYLLVYLIFGSQHDPIKVEKWRRICDQLMSAYDEANPLTAEERAALPLMMTAIELLFVSFWNREGNAEQSGAALDLAKWLWNRKW